MQSKISPQKKPYTINVKKGKKYAWCSCGLSKKQPFCDSSHRSTKYKPIVLTAEKSETIYFCGCKYTKNPPFCDGTHSSL